MSDSTKPEELGVPIAKESSSNKPLEHLQDAFGPWIEKPGKLSATFVVVIGGVVLFVKNLRELLTDPPTRWAAIALMVVISGVSSYQAAAKLAPNQDHPWWKRVPTFPALTFLLSIIILVGDFVATVCPLYSDLIVGAFYQEPTKTSIEVTEAEARRLASMPVVAISHSVDQSDKIDFPVHAPTFSFEAAKSSSVKSVIIDDVVLSVTDFQRAPEYFKATAGATFSDDVRLYFQIRKLDTPFPWNFKPVLASIDAKPVNLEAGSIVLRDEFSSRFRVSVDATDPGIYGFTLKIKYHSQMARQAELFVPSRRLHYAFLGAESDRQPDTKAVFVSAARQTIIPP